MEQTFRPPCCSAGVHHEGALLWLEATAKILQYCIAWSCTQTYLTSAKSVDSQDIVQKGVWMHA